MNQEKRTKWGILGTARIAERELIPALHKSELAEAYAVCSRSREKGEEYAQRNGLEKSYDDYEELLSDPEIEIVYNPLPNSLHAEWTIKAAKHGKNVLCEKPIALNLKETGKMFEVCESNDVILMEAFMYRFHPQTKRIKELLEEGAIGEPRILRGSHSFALAMMNREDDFRWKEEMGGGSLMDLGCYSVNTSRYLFGEEPERVLASSVYYSDFTAEAELQGILRFPDKKIAIIDSSFLLPHQAEYEIAGESGKIRATTAYRTEGEDVEIEIIQDGEKKIEKIDGIDEYRLEVNNMCRAIKGEEPPEISKQDTIGNIKTIRSLYESAKKEKPIKID